MRRSRNTLASWFIGSALLLAGLIAALAWPRRPSAAAQAQGPLLVYCAANLRVPLEEIASNYFPMAGIRVEAQYAGSQTILTNAELSGRGDLLLPADDSYIEMAEKKGMIARKFPVASMRPVLAVARGNPKHIRSLDDFFRPDVQFMLANPDAAAIGKVTRPVLEREALWDKLAARSRTFLPTVTDVANAVKLGTADVGIVWDTTVRQTQGLDAIDVPIFARTRGKVAMATLRSSGQSKNAEAFARYAASPDGGRRVFEKFGYRVATGEPEAPQ